MTISHHSRVSSTQCCYSYAVDCEQVRSIQASLQQQEKGTIKIVSLHIANDSRRPPPQPPLRQIGIRKPILSQQILVRKHNNIRSIISTMSRQFKCHRRLRVAPVTSKTPLPLLYCQPSLSSIFSTAGPIRPLPPSL